MKFRSALIALFSFSLMSGAFATNFPVTQDDVCANAAGHWSGSFVMKNEDHCKKHNGCAHYVAANVTQQGLDAYSVELLPSIGRPITVPGQCANGKLSSPMMPDASMVIKCPTGGTCTVSYEDTLLYVRMEKAEA